MSPWSLDTCPTNARWLQHVSCESHVLIPERQLPGLEQGPTNSFQYRCQAVRFQILNLSWLRELWGHQHTIGNSSHRQTMEKERVGLMSSNELLQTWPSVEYARFKPINVNQSFTYCLSSGLRYLIRWGRFQTAVQIQLTAQHYRLLLFKMDLQIFTNLENNQLDSHFKKPCGAWRTVVFFSVWRTLASDGHVAWTLLRFMSTTTSNFCGVSYYWQPLCHK
jgi:hypothetical protein